MQLNIWVPDPLVDDPGGTAAATAFLHRFGAPGPTGPDAPAYTAQCAAMLEAAPTAVSSIMGLFDADYVNRLHERGIAWFATAVTLDDALAAQEAGADAVIAQGSRRAATGAWSTRTRPSARRSGSSRWCRTSSTTCGCR